MFDEFFSASSYEAMLLTTPPIMRDAYMHKSYFRKWCRENALSLLKKREEVKDYDVRIVTATGEARS